MRNLGRCEYRSSSERDTVWLMATALFPNEIMDNHQRTEAYRMASRETVKITTSWFSLRSHSDGYHCPRTLYRDREDYRESYHTKPPTKTLTEWVMEGSETIAEWHTELNTKPHFQRPTKWLLRRKRIFYRSGLPRWPPRSRPGRHWSYHPNDFHREAATETLPDVEWRDAGIRICNVQSGFLKAEVRSYHGEYDHLRWEDYMVDTDQWHTAHAWCNCRMLPPSNGHQQVTYENQRLWRWQERKLTSLPKVTTRRRCNDVEIERIGTPHTTVSQQA
jgi:hypothetical protein